MRTEDLSKDKRKRARVAMKTLVCIGVVVVLFLFLVWLAWIDELIPEGYEDENGFHYGSKR